MLLAWNVAPLSKLYVTPEDGDVIVIVPVALAQVGCVTLAVGAPGTLNEGFTVAVVAPETHELDASFTIN